MTTSQTNSDLSRLIVESINAGVVVLNHELQVMQWNHFMENHSGISAAEIVGKSLFEYFPELPRKWLEKKINSVFVLKNFAFTSWEQRPWLFRFPHNRPITGEIDFMYQDCTFMPIRDADERVSCVCVTIFDVTDTAIYKKMSIQSLISLQESSSRDGLTGIFNRRHLDERFSVEFNRVKRYGGNLSVLLFDLDHFKNVNDSHGHAGGDEVLRVIARRVNNGLRNTDIFGRYGGEEFCVLLPNTDAAGAIVLAERIRHAVATSAVMHRDVAIPVTISIGISHFDSATTDYQLLLRQADTALYASKTKGRNCATIFTPAVAAAMPTDLLR